MGRAMVAEADHPALHTKTENRGYQSSIPGESGFIQALQMGWVVAAEQR